MLPDLYWLAMMKVYGNFYILASPTGKEINRFRSKEDGLNFFAKSYTQAHLCGIEGTEIACKFHNTLQPKIIGITQETIINELIDKNGKVSLITLSEDLGSLKGLTCNRPYDLVSKIYEMGESPKFLDDSFKSFVN